MGRDRDGGIEDRCGSGCKSCFQGAGKGDLHPSRVQALSYGRGEEE